MARSTRRRMRTRGFTHSLLALSALAVLLFIQSSSAEAVEALQPNQDFRFAERSPSCCPKCVAPPCPQSCVCYERRERVEAEPCVCPERPACDAEPCPPAPPCSCRKMPPRAYFSTNMRPLTIHPRTVTHLVKPAVSGIEFVPSLPSTGPTGRRREADRVVAKQLAAQQKAIEQQSAPSVPATPAPAASPAPSAPVTPPSVAAAAVVPAKMDTFALEDTIAELKSAEKELSKPKKKPDTRPAPPPLRAPRPDPILEPKRARKAKQAKLAKKQQKKQKAVEKAARKQALKKQKQKKAKAPLTKAPKKPKIVIPFDKPEPKPIWQQKPPPPPVPKFNPSNPLSTAEPKKEVPPPKPKKPTPKPLPALNLSSIPEVKPVEVPQTEIQEAKQLTLMASMLKKEEVQEQLKQQAAVEAKVQQRQQAIEKAKADQAKADERDPVAAQARKEAEAAKQKAAEQKEQRKVDKEKRELERRLDMIPPPRLVPDEHEDDADRVGLRPRPRIDGKCLCRGGLCARGRVKGAKAAQGAKAPKGKAAGTCRRRRHRRSRKCKKGSPCALTRKFARKFARKIRKFRRQRRIRRRQRKLARAARRKAQSQSLRDATFDSSPAGPGPKGRGRGARVIRGMKCTLRRSKRGRKGRAGKRKGRKLRKGRKHRRGKKGRKVRRGKKGRKVRRGKKGRKVRRGKKGRKVRRGKKGRKHGRGRKVRTGKKARRHRGGKKARRHRGRKHRKLSRRHRRARRHHGRRNRRSRRGLKGKKGRRTRRGLKGKKGRRTRRGLKGKKGRRTRRGRKGKKRRVGKKVRRAGKRVRTGRKGSKKSRRGKRLRFVCRKPGKVCICRVPRKGAKGSPKCKCKRSRRGGRVRRRRRGARPSGGIAYRKLAAKRRSKAYLARRKLLKIKYMNNAKAFRASGRAPPKFRIANGLCVGQGFLSVPKIGEPVAKVPFRCRPQQRAVLGVHLRGVTTARFDVDPKGVLEWMDGSKLGRLVPLNSVVLVPRKTKLHTLRTAKGWLAESSEFGTAGWTRIGGLCVLSGVVKLAPSQPVWPTHIATLDPDCTPEDGSIMFGANVGNETVQLEITTSGVVQYVDGAHSYDWISLDGVVFYPKLSKNDVDLERTFRGFGSGTRHPSFNRFGRLCVVSGRVQGEGTSPVIGTLPATCRPSGRVRFGVMGQTGPQKVDAYPNGTLVWSDGTSVQPGWVSLDGVRILHDINGRAPRPRRPAARRLVMKPVHLGLNVTAYRSKDPEMGVVTAYPLPRVTRMGKVCMLSGYVSTEGWGEVTLQLPKYCWPENRHIYDLQMELAEGATTARVDVFPSGNLRWVGGARGPYIPLEGLTIIPRGVPTAPIVLSPFWTNWGDSYDRASFVVQNGYCFLSGLIRVKGNSLKNWNHVIGELPAQCRPADGKVAFSVNSHDESHIVEVYTNGQLIWAAGKKVRAFLSLDGIAFQTKPANRLHYAFQVPTNPDQGYRPLSYSVYEYPGGVMCMLSGSVNSVTPADARVQVQMHVPAACKPRAKQPLIFNINDGSKSTKFTIKDGLLLDSATPRLGVGKAFTLNMDGIRYVVPGPRQHAFKPKPQPKPKPKPKPTVAKQFTTETGVTAYGADYQEPTFRRAGPFCFVSGVAKVEVVQSGFLSLPRKCVPSAQLIFDAHTTGTANIRVDVTKLGRVEWRNGATKGDFVWFDGIAFPVNSSRSSELELTAGWTNVGLKYSPATVTRRGGVCMLSGTIRTKNGSPQSWEDTVATVPAACRPVGGTAVFSVNHDDLVHQIEVRPNGAVVTTKGNRVQPWVSLDGIVYSVVSSLRLLMGPDFADGPSGYRIPSSNVRVVKGVNVCLLSGVATRKSEGSNLVATLPATCRPAKRLMFSANNVGAGTKVVRLDAYPDGRLLLADGDLPSGSTVSLDAVHFVLGEASEEAVAQAELERLAARSKPKPVKIETEKLYPDGPLKLGSTLVPWDASAGYLSASFFRRGKVCVLSGVAATETLVGEYARLPANCLPKVATSFDAHFGKGSKTARIDIKKNGHVKWRAGVKQGEMVSFDGMHFVTNDSDSSELTLTAPWANANESFFGTASFTKQGELCVLSGLVQAAGEWKDGMPILTLPEECRPAPDAGDLVFSLNNEESSHRVDITAKDGKLVWRAGTRSADTLSLGGIAFVTGGNVSNSLDLLPAYGAPTMELRELSFNRVGDLCVVSGSFRKVSSAAEGDVVQLPAHCRPSGTLVLHALGSSPAGDLSWHTVRVSSKGFLSVAHPSTESGLTLHLTGTVFAVSPASSKARAPRPAPRTVKLVSGHTGGWFSRDNLAREDGARPFASGDATGQNRRGVNDGVYGNANAWAPGESLRGLHFVGVQFSAPRIVRSIAFGRDNNGVLSDKIPAKYSIEYAVEKGDEFTADSAWMPLGDVFAEKLEGELPARRHVFNLNKPVQAGAIRVVVSSPAAAIDELEVYSNRFVSMKHKTEQSGGQFLPHNLARPDGVAFASSVYPSEVHQIKHLNDGIYGNSYSWIPKPGQQGLVYGGVRFASIVSVQSIAFGRDNRGQYKDRADGEVIVQVTSEPRADQDTPDNKWTTVGAVMQKDLQRPALRHLFYLSEAVSCSAVRLIQRKGPSGLDIAIDEIEAYSRLHKS